MRPVVLIHHPGPGDTAAVVPAEMQILLGRSSRCDLVVDHPTVSRQHAALSAVRGGLRVTDLDSSNGTFIGGVRVAGSGLARHGSRVRFGEIDFLALVQGGVAAPAGSDELTDKPPPREEPPAPAAGPGLLTEAQRRVCALLLKGMGEKQIASGLKISPCTVHNHVAAIYRAFGVHSRAELLVLALSRTPTP